MHLRVVHASQAELDALSGVHRATAAQTDQAVSLDLVHSSRRPYDDLPGAVRSDVAKGPGVAVAQRFDDSIVESCALEHAGRGHERRTPTSEPIQDLGQAVQHAWSGSD